jgi:hypothetical protein
VSDRPFVQYLAYPPRGHVGWSLLSCTPHLPGGTDAQGPSGKEGLPGKEGKEGKEATDASNSLALGGIPASGYTRSECGSISGAIKGFAQVPASSTFSSSFTKVAFAYSCSGEAVEAKRTSEGQYEIKFLGNPADIVVGSSNQPGSSPDIDVVSFAPVGGGDWKVAIWNVPTGKFIDDQFQVILP